MKDTLRQPDGKIRTACKFCRQRKKKCSGEMPCSSCVNFNRDCCVYDRWVASSSSARPKQESTPTTITRPFSWADHNNNNVQPTSPCFTSKVLLTKVQPSYQNCCPPSAPSLLLQSAFVPQSDSSTSSTAAISSSSPWSPFDSPLSMQSTPLSPAAEAMMRTVSLPNFLDRSWTQDTSFSPVLDASPSSQLSLTMDTSTQASSPSSPAGPQSPTEPHSGLASPSSFTTPTGEVQSFRQLLYDGEKETHELLQNVDALLMHLGNA